jgi:hydroxymethylglutaryl-CoA reductase
MERIRHLPSAPALGDGHQDDPSIYERNVENFSGTVRVPVGLAGPLSIDGGAVLRVPRILRIIGLAAVAR